MNLEPVKIVKPHLHNRLHQYHLRIHRHQPIVTATISSTSTASVNLIATNINLTSTTATINLITKAVTICFSSKTAITSNHSQPHLQYHLHYLHLHNDDYQPHFIQNNHNQPHLQTHHHQFHYHNHHHQPQLHSHQHHFLFHNLRH